MWCLCYIYYFCLAQLTLYLSWAKDMNVFHSFCESSYNRTVREAKQRGILVFLFFCFTQFTSFVYKYLIIDIDNFQNYHWIQHRKTQPVVVTSEREINPYSKISNIFSINPFLWASYLRKLSKLEIWNNHKMFSELVEH